MSDDALAYLVRQLEAKVAALKLSSTAAGVALYRQFTEKLDAIRNEQLRRRI